MLGKCHGWIECESTSFPGKVYYFHTETRCSTWQRPVPRNTQLPRYKKWRVRKNRRFESFFFADLLFTVKIFPGFGGRRVSAWGKSASIRSRCLWYRVFGYFLRPAFRVWTTRSQDANLFAKEHRLSSGDEKNQRIRGQRQAVGILQERQIGVEEKSESEKTYAKEAGQGSEP